MRYLICTLAVLILAACGSEKPKGEEVPDLSTAAKRLSYALGAENADQLMNSGDPSVTKFDKNEMVKGFELGITKLVLSDTNCMKVIENLVGPTRREFNMKYVKEGSFCVGKYLGTVFLNSFTATGQLDKLDKKLVVYGFEKALYDQDTLLAESDRREVVQNFMQDVQQKQVKENDQRDKKYFAELAKRKDLVKLENGVYLEVIKPGKGASPAVSDDVDADYILMHTTGDTIQSSFEMKKMGQKQIIFNLQSVVRGWQIGFQKMQRGGKYRLYVPTEMGYGANPPDPKIGPMVGLVFYIELHNFGPQGSLQK